MQINTKFEPGDVVRRKEVLYPELFIDAVDVSFHFGGDVYVSYMVATEDRTRRFVSSGEDLTLVRKGGEEG